jgi:hypothetical protein
MIFLKRGATSWKSIKARRLGIYKYTMKREKIKLGTEKEEKKNQIKER